MIKITGTCDICGTKYDASKYGACPQCYDQGTMKKIVNTAGKIAKGTLWATGKLLQGTAFLVSKGIEEHTGIDYYGSIKDSIRQSKENDKLTISSKFQERDEDKVNSKNREIKRKRASMLKAKLKNLSNENLLSFDTGLIQSEYDLRAYEQELRHRGIDRSDYEYLSRKDEILFESNSLYDDVYDDTLEY